MQNEYTYGVARIRAMESSLFSDDTIEQLLQCKDYNECLNFLRDKGWGNGNPDESLDAMLKIEKNRTAKIIEEIVEDDEDCRILTINDEFHNLKAAVKQVCTNQNSANIFIESGRLKPDFLTECIRQGDYNLLPEYMSGPAKEATEVLLQTGDGQLCDIIIDRAALEEIIKIGDSNSNDLVKKYARLQVAIANIKISIRCAAAGKGGRFAKKALVACEGVSVDELARAVDSGLEDVYSYLENAGYKDAVEAFKISKSVFECWCDNRIIEMIKDEKYHSFTIGPILAYSIARNNEIKTVKIILSGKLNGFDNDFIKERIRVMYA